MNEGLGTKKAIVSLFPWLFLEPKKMAASYVFETSCLKYCWGKSQSMFWHSCVPWILQLETLLNFFPVPSYRNLTLQCLTEVCTYSIVRTQISNVKCSWTASTFSFWCLDIGRLLPLILAISITCSTLKCILSLWCNCRYLNGLIKISLEIWRWVCGFAILVVNIFWVPFLSPFSGFSLQ